MKRVILLSALLSLVSTSAFAAGANSLASGATSLSLSIPAGGNPYAPGTFGIWYGLSPELNLGINVGLGIDTAPVDDVFNLLLAPALKYYFRPNAEITPFIIGQINLGFTSAGNDAVDFGILGGFGVEWFVTPVFSVAGYTGAGIDLLRPNDTEPFRFGTFTSGLSAQLYF